MTSKDGLVLSSAAPYNGGAGSDDERDLRGEELAQATAAETAGEIVSQSGQATARRAVDHLVKKHGFIEPTKEARKNLAMAFAGINRVVYGKAFDALKVSPDASIDLNDLDSVIAGLGHVTLYEVKSTKRELSATFEKYFFSLSTAELLVAQSLQDQFKFAFVSVTSGDVLELTLREVYARTKAVYPSWSIRF